MTSPVDDKWARFRRLTFIALACYIVWFLITLAMVMNRGFEEVIADEYIVVVTLVGVICLMIIAYHAYHGWRNLRKPQ